MKLLGGESYPRDITTAIKDQTFRVIALLSRSSIAKPNPVKERTLALSIAKERNIDFLIPINVDGLKATELDFMTSDLVYISFDKSWFVGLSSLLKKLHQIGTPRDERIGREAIARWLSTIEQPSKRTETQWSNLIPILEIPSRIRRYIVRSDVNVRSIAPDWSVFWEDRNTLLAFGPPESSSSDWLKEADVIDYPKSDYTASNAMKRVLAVLVRLGVERLCLRRGLRASEESKRIYFPPSLIVNDRLRFTRYDGKKTYVQVVGERRFRTISQGNVSIETSRYHLSLGFKPFMDLLGHPVSRLRLGVYWTDTENRPLEAKKANRRRKTLCKDWWNYQWLSRTIAVLQWLGNGREEITILRTDSGDLRIGLKPLAFSSDLGIDEDALSAIGEEDDPTVLEDSEEDDEDATTITA